MLVWQRSISLSQWLSGPEGFCFVESNVGTVACCAQSRSKLLSQKSTAQRAIFVLICFELPIELPIAS